MITKKTLTKLKTERDEWAEFLNKEVGTLAFCLGAASLGTSTPFLVSTASIVFLMVIMCNGIYRFPMQQIKALKGMQLEGLEEVKLLGIESKFYGPLTLVKTCPIYLAGFISLIFVWLGTGLGII